MSQPFVFHTQSEEGRLDEEGRREFVANAAGTAVTFFFGEEYWDFAVNHERRGAALGDSAIDRVVTDARPDRAALISIMIEGGETLSLSGFQDTVEVGRFAVGGWQRCLVMASENPNGTRFTVVSWAAAEREPTREIDVDGLLFDNLPVSPHLAIAQAKAEGFLYFTEQRRLRFEPVSDAVALSRLGANSAQPNGLVNATGPQSPLRQWHGWSVMTHGRVVSVAVEVVRPGDWTGRPAAATAIDAVEFDFIPRAAGPLNVFNARGRRLGPALDIPGGPLRVRVSGFARGASRQKEASADERYVIEITSGEGLPPPAAPAIRSGFGRQCAAGRPSTYYVPPMEHLRSADGTVIAYARSGSGPPLVLVHGSMADHTRWGRVLPALAAHFTVYALDRRGRGASGASMTVPYAIEREFEDVAAVVDAVGRPVALLGHSYGGLCALEAARRTGNVRALVLYEPPLLIPTVGSTTPPGVVATMEAQLAAGDREGVVLTFMRELARMPEEAIAGQRASSTWPARVAAAHTALDEARGGGSYAFAPARFRDLTTPTLLLVGSESPPFLRAATEALAAALPHGQTRVLADQGHVAMDSAPDLFLREVVAFLAPHPS